MGFDVEWYRVLFGSSDDCLNEMSCFGIVFKSPAEVDDATLCTLSRESLSDGRRRICIAELHALITSILNDVQQSGVTQTKELWHAFDCFHRDVAAKLWQR
jgi:hypothetical protein